jgi:hypothetical protein
VRHGTKGRTLGPTDIVADPLHRGTCDLSVASVGRGEKRIE